MVKRVNSKTGVPFKRGDLDDEGNIFFCYQKNVLRDDGYFGERWISEEEQRRKARFNSLDYDKTCTKCGIKKIAKNNFYKKLSSQDGYEAWCKTCVNKKNKKWFDENIEKHHKLTERWYKKNRDKHLKNSKENYKKNPKRKLLDYYRREKRTAQATPPWVDKNQLIEIYKEAERKTVETGVPHEVDHIIPLQHDRVCGLNVPWNLQILTRTENRKKANKWKPD